MITIYQYIFIKIVFNLEFRCLKNWMNELNSVYIRSNREVRVNLNQFVYFVVLGFS